MQFYYCTVSNPGTGADDAFVLNCRSLNSNLDYLTHYLSQHPVHVLCVQSPACHRGDLPKIDVNYYPPVSGLHPSISGRVGTVTYVQIGCKFVTVASQLEAEASICSIKTEQTTRHITVHNVYYPEGDGEGEWLKYLSDSHCLVFGGGDSSVVRAPDS